MVALVSCATRRPTQPAVEPIPPPVTRPDAPTLRLPKGVVPLSYEVEATVVPSLTTFPTRTRIELRLDVRTDRIWLNQNKLEFKSASITFDGQSLKATAVPQAEHFVGIELERAIGPGVAVLQIEAIAQLSRVSAQGAFVGTQNGTDYVFTNLEPYGARRIFPIFDEPAFKVPWKLRLTVPKDMVAVANSPAESEAVEGDFKTVAFAPTPPMSSYLFAFAVGPFDVVDAGTAGRKHIPIRIVVPHGEASRVSWAVEVSAEALARVESYFDLPFPYPKLDLVALVGPNFKGAMENPGLITYADETILLGGSAETNYRRREFVATTVHEIAHHWFGDLVTPAWWDDLWLNEAFAVFLDNRIVTLWKPEWGGLVERVEVRNGAMATDSFFSARRIREPIISHGDINNAFDDITYSKGASILYMFEQWLGPEAFQRGVKRYLERNAWKSVTAQDFLQALHDETGRELSQPFETFLNHSGVPRVETELQCEPHQPVKLTIRQRKQPSMGYDRMFHIWKVPVCVRWDSGKQCTLLETEQTTLQLPTQTCPQWLLGNDGEAGYYYVKPAPFSLLSNPALSVEERVGVLHHIEALVEAGDLSVGEQLSSIDSLMASGRRQLMAPAVSMATHWYGSVPAAVRPQVAAFVRHHFAKKAKALSFAPKRGESDDDEFIRPALLWAVGDAGEDPATRAEAVRLSYAWLKSHSAVPDNLSSVAFSLAGRSNLPALLEAELAAVRTEPSRNARRTLFTGLGSFTDGKLAERALGVVLAPGVDVRESMAVVRKLGHHHQTRQLAFDFVRANYDALTKALPPEWESDLVEFGVNFCSQEKRTEVMSFFQPRTTKALGGQRDFATALERLDDCIAQEDLHMPDAVEFFTNWKKP
jgi:alanyl aminopeptidase